MKKSILVLVLAGSLSVVNAFNCNNTVIAKDVNTTITTTPKIKVTALCKAIAVKDYALVERLLKLGVDVNEKTNGKTPLMYAARYNQAAIFKLLISHGADLSIKSKQGFDVNYYAKISNATRVAALIKSQSILV